VICLHAAASINEFMVNKGKSFVQPCHPATSPFPSSLTPSHLHWALGSFVDISSICSSSILCARHTQRYTS